MSPILAKQNNTTQENMGIFLCPTTDINPSISMLKASKTILFLYIGTTALYFHVFID
jgi:hypothetical protein